MTIVHAVRYAVHTEGVPVREIRITLRCNPAVGASVVKIRILDALMAVFRAIDQIYAEAPIDGSVTTIGDDPDSQKSYLSN